MDEIRWQHGLEEYRAVQQLARDGEYQAAMDRAYHALLVGGLGRRSAARLHSLLCWIYLFGLKQPSPVAMLHGEEAVRLADLCSDAWIRSEALARLIPAYCQMGDLARANQACDQLEREVGQNELVLPEGRSALWMLRALISLAQGESKGRAHALNQAQAHAQHLPDRLARLQGLQRFLEAVGEAGRQTWTEPEGCSEAGGGCEPAGCSEADGGCEAEGCSEADGGCEADGWHEADRGIEPAGWPELDLEPMQQDGHDPFKRRPAPWLEEEGEEAARVRAILLEALLLEGSSLPTATELAKQALQRTLSRGRIDLAALVRRHLAHLLA